MKGMFAKQGFRTLVAMFFVAFAMLMTAERMSAQSLTGGTNVVVDKQTTFQANPDAIIALTNSLNNYWGPQQTAAPSDLNVLRHCLYYKAIIVQLMSGEGVGTALINALPAAVEQGSLNPIPGGNQAVLQNLYEDAKQVVKL